MTTRRSRWWSKGCDDGGGSGFGGSWFGGSRSGSWFRASRSWFRVHCEVWRSGAGDTAVNELADLDAAAAIVYAAMAPTPQQRWPLLDARAGAAVWVKHE